MNDDLCAAFEPFIDPPAPTLTTPPVLPGAEDRYAANHARCCALLADIEAALLNLPAPDAGITISWAHAGSMEEAVVKLRDALDWIREIR
jgi:hypothetical protein